MSNATPIPHPGSRGQAPAGRRPLLPLGEQVLFPHAVRSFEVQGAAARAALDAVAAEGDGDGLLGAVPSLGRARRAQDAAGAAQTVGAVGTLARVLERLELGGGRVRVLLQGVARARRGPVTAEGALLAAEWEVFGAGEAPDAETHGRGEDRAADPDGPISQALALLAQLMRGRQLRGRELAAQLSAEGLSARQRLDAAAQHLALAFADRVKLLEEPSLEGRAERLLPLLRALEVKGDAGLRLRGKVKERLRRVYLREQLEVIRSELGERDPLAREVEALERRLERTALSPAARAAGRRELEHLRRLPPGSPHAAQLHAYLEWLLELPWIAPRPERSGGDPRELARVERALAKSHAGLGEVKQRVIETLAVRQLGGRPRGGALCFLGPPGTGKSSMARAVARALGRPFVSIAVGAMTDERQLVGRSHRLEGAFPGALIDGLKRAGRPDPVVLLDEIDKLQLGGGGDAGGVLLQVLDPDQSVDFVDQYLGLPFDLSRCLFLATASDTEEMSEALLDRLEIVEFSGFTEAEKLAIARGHLLPRARAEAGLSASQFQISPGALTALLRGYTEEAGVRQLKRLIEALARKAAVAVVRDGAARRVHKRDLADLVGPARADEEVRARRPRVGVALGLAWTSAGGSLLPVEALAMPGSGRTQLTGQVGDVLRESFQTAVSFARTRLGSLGLGKAALDELDLHLHFPSGAVPKDGPSAGLAIAVSLFSLLARRQVRHDMALTGEVSLLGQVLPVGGLKEKLLAAIRAGLRSAVVPARNAEEVLRLPSEIRSKLTVHLVDRVDEALDLALVSREGEDGPWLRAGGLRRKGAAAQRRGRRAAPAPPAATPPGPPPTGIQAPSSDSPGPRRKGGRGPKGGPPAAGG